jgi:NADH-quinone oxidoreductase subunit A
MTDALSSSVSLVAYLTLFGGVAVVFLLANLLVGRLVRPADPHPEKLEIYECGEPTIGSSFVQFDLRFYVVALLFIIFDVEVAFFFPWATVFGKSTHLMREDLAVAERVEGRLALTPDAQAMYRELGVTRPEVPLSMPGESVAGLDDLERAEWVAHEGARQLAWVTLVDILAFFGVLMIGFLYVWKRGDLDWVRAMVQDRAIVSEAASSETAAGEPGRRAPEPVLSA